MKGWKHAFAVDPPGEHAPTAEQQEVVDWVCKQFAKRHLTTPGLIFLEMTRPLNYLGSQTMRFFDPMISVMIQKKLFRHYQHFARFLEHRGSMDYLCRRIEHFEHEYDKLSKTDPAEPPNAVNIEPKSDQEE